MIYLDNNATTAIDPQVLESMREVWSVGPLNPSSQHAAGRQARTLVHQACTVIGRLLGTDIIRTGGSQLLLTSGGTEANNWAVAELVARDRPRWISSMEHPSVLEAAEHLAGEGGEVRWIPVDPQGIVRVDQLESTLGERLGDPAAESEPTIGRGPPDRGLVSVMAANNETGVLQPIAEIASLCRRWRVAFHCDATQWIGKLPFDFDSLGATAITFAPHKFHGPVGIGALLVAPRVHLRPQFFGGQQQLGLRPGTEPVPLIVGMQRALQIASESFETVNPHVRALREAFERTLRASIPGSVVHGSGAPRLPGTTSISFPHVDRQMLLVRLDMLGVAASSGSACTSGSSQPSHVLRAMGLPEAQIDAALRFSFGRLSTSTDAVEGAERIVSCFKKLRSD